MDGCILSFAENARGQKRNRSGSFGPRIRESSRVQVHDLEMSSGSVLVERKAFRSVVEPVEENPANDTSSLANGEHQARAIETLDNLAIEESLMQHVVLRRGSSSSSTSDMSIGSSGESETEEMTSASPAMECTSITDTGNQVLTNRSQPELIRESGPNRRRSHSFAASPTNMVARIVDPVVSKCPGMVPMTKNARSPALDADEPTCLICMGKFTGKKPASKIPCVNNCNDAPVHEKCIYNWKERPRLPKGRCPLCRSDLGNLTYIPPDIVCEDFLRSSVHARKDFISLPIPKEAGVVRFYVRVVSTGILSSYELYLQTKCHFPYPQGHLPSSESMSSDLLLLSARKRIVSWGSSHLDISLTPNEKADPTAALSTADMLKDCYVGTVQSSFSGLVHTVVAPTALGGNKELVCIRYTQNRITKIGPRRIQVSLPKVVEDDSPATRRVVENSYNLDEEEEEESPAPVVPAGVVHLNEKNQNAPPKKYWVTKTHLPTKGHSLPEVLYSGREKVESNENMLYAENKEPYWLDAIRAYSLDFQGRVTLPSNKNFQLLVSPNTRDVALQFGQVEDSPSEIYTMDVQWPLSPAQAFGICLSACDRKLLCA